MNRLSWVWVLVAACGQSEAPDVLLDAVPSRIDFGEVTVGQDRVIPVSLRYRGPNTALVRRFDADDFLVPVLAFSAPAILNSEQPTPVAVTFRPIRAGLWAGDLRMEVESWDGELLSLVVPVGGSGVLNDLVARPASLDFGRVAVGGTQTATLTLENLGPGPVELRAVTFESGSSAAFSARIPSVQTLQPSQVYSLQVEFSPFTSGISEGSLAVASSNRIERPVQVDLLGEGVFSELEVEPASLNFGETLVDEVRGRELRLRNLGSEAVALEVEAPDGPFVFSGIGQVVLQPGQAFQQEVWFQPTATGSYDSVLRFRTGTETVAVPMTGTAAGRREAAVSVPLVLDFGEVSLGHATRRTVWVEALSGPSLVSVPTLTGDPAFSLIRAFERLSPGQRRRAVIEFSPIEAGPRSAQLAVGSSTVSISAAGVPRAVPELTVDPDRLQFGRFSWGLQPTRKLLIKNSGVAALQALQADLTGPFIFTLRPPQLLEPGEMATVRVRFIDSQVKEGIRSGTLSLFADGVAASVPMEADVVLQQTPTDTAVELRWAETADLELHVVRGTLWSVPDDVAWCNPSPIWNGGDAEELEPWMLEDENVETVYWDPVEPIRIEVTALGTLSATAEVSVRVRGALLGTSRRRVGPGARWQVGTVRSDNGTFRFEPIEGPLLEEVQITCDGVQSGW